MSTKSVSDQPFQSDSVLSRSSEAPSFKSEDTKTREIINQLFLNIPNSSDLRPKRSLSESQYTIKEDSYFLPSDKNKGELSAKTQIKLERKKSEISFSFLRSKSNPIPSKNENSSQLFKTPPIQDKNSWKLRLEFEMFKYYKNSSNRYEKKENLVDAFGLTSLAISARLQEAVVFFKGTDHEHIVVTMSQITCVQDFVDTYKKLSKSQKKIISSVIGGTKTKKLLSSLRKEGYPSEWKGFEHCIEALAKTLQSFEHYEVLFPEGFDWESKHPIGLCDISQIYFSFRSFLNGELFYQENDFFIINEIALPIPKLDAWAKDRELPTTQLKNEWLFASWLLFEIESRFLQTNLSAQEIYEIVSQFQTPLSPEQENFMKAFLRTCLESKELSELQKPNQTKSAAPEKIISQKKQLILQAFLSQQKQFSDFDKSFLSLFEKELQQENSIFFEDFSPELGYDASTQALGLMTLLLRKYANIKFKPFLSSLPIFRAFTFGISAFSDSKLREQFPTLYPLYPEMDKPAFKHDKDSLTKFRVNIDKNSGNFSVEQRKTYKLSKIDPKKLSSSFEKEKKLASFPVSMTTFGKIGSETYSGKLSIGEVTFCTNMTWQGQREVIISIEGQMKNNPHAKQEEK